MTTYYVQTNLLCFILLAIVASLIRNDHGSLTARRLTFRSLILFTVVMCVSDVVASIFNSVPGNGARFCLQLMNITYDASITVVCYTWLNYVYLRVDGLEKYSPQRKLMSAIPLLVMLAFLFTNPFTNLIFHISAENVYSRGPLLFIHWIISWGYLAFATGVVISRIRRTESFIEKRALTPLLWFIVPPAVAAIAQMLFYGVTATQCGITVSVVIIAFTAVQEKVSRDTLTDLNNRTAFDNYINERLTRSGTTITLLMCDVDKFKTINDTLGHIMGDLVLKKMAAVLKEACGSTRAPVFLCRYGGDEFVICSTSITNEDVDRLQSAINEGLSTINLDVPSEIALGMSIGIARGNCCTYKDVEKLIRRADEYMYDEKRAK